MSEPAISDYALIGNSRSCALISKTGSLDWCCIPEFDSPAVFAALLDREKGGCFSIHPASDFRSAHQYLGDTNVLQTHFICEEGEIRLLDAFTVMTEEEKTGALFPEHEILRVIEGVSGTVRLRVHYEPRRYYGKSAAVLEYQKKLGIKCSWKEHMLSLLSSVDPDQIQMEQILPDRYICEFTVRAGERIVFSLSYSNHSPAVLPEVKTTGWKRMETSIQFWKDWLGQCKYTGLYKEQVRRSALALKLLAHAPSGAIIAAPTTSLPEQTGGVRNWDYRYCWLRDASFTIRVLVSLGFEEEAHAYMNWILHATRLTRPKLQVVYSIFGITSLKEKSLDWLSGYRDSRPARIGNEANGQFQLDLYGEVLDAVYAYSPLVKEFDRTTKKFILGLGEAICELWDEPDNGIWEVRSQLIHHTHSKVMACVGLDRLLKLAGKYGWKNVPVDKYKEIKQKISDKIEQEGYNTSLNSYTRGLQDDTLDGSLLTFSLVGYCDVNAPRMLNTCERIYQHLTKNNLVYRYHGIDDGLPGEEGTFAVCTFWLAENFAKSGNLPKAMELFEAMIQHSSPTGLWSEEIDPDTCELLGNYPQAFTHIGLINAAITINEAFQKGEEAE